jgi:hypothetical protein
MIAERQTAAMGDARSYTGIEIAPVKILCDKE